MSQMLIPKTRKESVALSGHPQLYRQGQVLDAWSCPGDTTTSFPQRIPARPPVLREGALGIVHRERRAKPDQPMSGDRIRPDNIPSMRDHEGLKGCDVAAASTDIDIVQAARMDEAFAIRSKGFDGARELCDHTEGGESA